MNDQPDPTTQPAAHEPTVSTEAQLLCPLCGYDLRGLEIPRCPECGYRCTWEELLDPRRRLHPYLFEHHPEAGASSFLKTLLGGLRPTLFWTALHPTQPSSPRRLLLYWLITAMLTLAGGLSQYLSEARDLAARNSARRTREIPIWYQQPDLKAMAIEKYGSVEAWAENAYPPATSPRMWRMVFQQSGILLSMVLAVAAMLLWPWVSYLALLVFQISMRRAKIQAIHVKRCLVYSSDAFVWPSLALFAFTLIAPVATGTGTGSLSQRLCSLWLVTILLTYVFAIGKLSQGYRKYLRFDHVAATILSSQAIVILAYVNVFAAFALLSD